ncbi:MAG TPA: tryptophan synthase subunit alpha [Actinobacteria bacterium]|nr:tryptophan synthase subunit alpha [Actinomycetota bacterium]
MNRITEAFKKGKALITFITGGDPDIGTTEKLIQAMEKAGADLIEIGIPFSDPVAEGAVIQDADERALKAGCTTDKLFEMVSRVRKKTDIPLLLMTYINPVFTYGKEKFSYRCAECGIDGIIVPDMPFEERDELLEELEAGSIDLISMIAPTSEERIEMIAAQARGFIYCVSSLGVTGVRENITTDIGKMIKKIRTVTNTPCAIGFGISTPEQAGIMASLSDGVIVGSAIVKLIAKYGRNSIGPVSEFVAALKKGIEDKR